MCSKDLPSGLGLPQNENYLITLITLKAVLESFDRPVTMTITKTSIISTACTSQTNPARFVYKLGDAQSREESGVLVKPHYDIDS